MVGSVSFDSSAFIQELFQKADADGNGSLSKAEFTKMDKEARARAPQTERAADMPSSDAIFEKADANGDGALTKDEFSAMLEKARADTGSPPPGGGAGGGPAGGAQGAGSASEETDAADTDGNGTVSDAEYKAYYGVERPAWERHTIDVTA